MHRLFQCENKRSQKDDDQNRITDVPLFLFPVRDNYVHVYTYRKILIRKSLICSLGSSKEQ